MRREDEMLVELQNYFFAVYWLRSVELETTDLTLRELRAECSDELCAISHHSTWPRLRAAADNVLAEQEDRRVVHRGRA